MQLRDVADIVDAVSVEVGKIGWLFAVGIFEIIKAVNAVTCRIVAQLRQTAPEVCRVEDGQNAGENNTR